MKATTDVWFASYLKLRGFAIGTFEVIERNKGRFYFIISDAEWKRMKIEFDTSETSKIKQMQGALKDLLH